MTDTWSAVYKSCKDVMLDSFRPTLPKQWCETGCGADHVCDARESAAMTADANYCSAQLGLGEIPTTCSTAAQNLTRNGQNCCFVFARWHALAMGGQGVQRMLFSMPSTPAYLAVPRPALLQTAEPGTSLWEFVNGSSAPNLLVATQPPTCPSGRTAGRRQVLAWGGAVYECN